MRRAAGPAGRLAVWLAAGEQPPQRQRQIEMEEYTDTGVETGIWTGREIDTEARIWTGREIDAETGIWTGREMDTETGIRTGKLQEQI